MKARAVNAIQKIYFPTPFADCCREYERVTDPKQLPSDFGSKLEHKVLKCINDSRYIEHDAYFLFDSIMLNMWEWYFVAEAVPSSSSNAAFSTVINGARARTNVISVEATEQRLFSGDNRGDEGRKDHILKLSSLLQSRMCAKLVRHSLICFRSLWRCPTSSKGVGQRLGNPRPGAVPSSRLEFRIAHDVRH